LDEWRARREQSPDQSQARGDDRGQDQAGAHSRGENLAPDHWQDRYRDRYDRRRARYDEWRRAREDRHRSRDRDEDVSRSRAAERGDAALPRGRSGPFGGTIDKLVRGCAAQAAEFENWPFDAISRTEPKLQAFYAALHDEQKARLYRDMATPAAATAADTTGVREAREEPRDRYSSRRDRWRAYAAAREAAAREERGTAKPPVPAGTAPARSWPRCCATGRCARSSTMCDSPARSALRSTSSLPPRSKPPRRFPPPAPPRAALTPVGRMETMRKRLTAVRAATAAIRPVLARFYEALDQGQKVHFAGMS
jgi:hypothetical protein